jgi:hypothetical protein
MTSPASSREVAIRDLLYGREGRRLYRSLSIRDRRLVLTASNSPTAESVVIASLALRRARFEQIGAVMLATLVESGLVIVAILAPSLRIPALVCTVGVPVAVANPWRTYWRPAGEHNRGIVARSPPTVHLEEGFAALEWEHARYAQTSLRRRALRGMAIGACAFAVVLITAYGIRLLFQM